MCSPLVRRSWFVVLVQSFLREFRGYLPPGAEIKIRLCSDSPPPPNPADHQVVPFFRAYGPQKVYIRRGDIRVADERRRVQRVDQHHLKERGIVRGMPGCHLLHRNGRGVCGHRHLLPAGRVLPFDITRDA